MAEENEFKICLVGASGVGKTTWITRHTTGEFVSDFTPTVGVEVSKLTFYTSAGRVALNMWDLAGDDKLGGLRDGYLLNADGVIYMYDVTDSSSYDAIPDWIKLNGRINENIPAVIAGTKVDLPNKAVSKPTLGKKHSLQLYEISSLSNFNFEKPFLFLIRRLLADPDIEFVEAPAL